MIQINAIPPRMERFDFENGVEMINTIVYWHFFNVSHYKIASFSLAAASQM